MGDATEIGGRMGHYDTPEDAYFAFFERFSAEDAAGWAACMSYPHVRVAPPREGVDARTTARYYPTPEDYAAAADWTPFKAAGWVRTQGVEPVRLHESDDMVHLLGGWTRYNKDDEPIVSNRVTYLLTRLDTGWGIQARFGNRHLARRRRHQRSRAGRAGRRAVSDQPRQRR